VEGEWRVSGGVLPLTFHYLALTLHSTPLHSHPTHPPLPPLDLPFPSSYPSLTLHSPCGGTNPSTYLPLTLHYPPRTKANHAIRSISLIDGYVSTLAGGGSGEDTAGGGERRSGRAAAAGHLDGPGASARFRAPADVALDGGAALPPRLPSPLARALLAWRRTLLAP